MLPLVVHRHPKTGQKYIEDLGNGERLEMMRIPPGEFCMGSPKTEEGRYDRESPQHWVTVNDEFCLGKYPITQGQWRAVINSTDPLLEEKYPLKPEPAKFTDDYEENGKTYSRWQRPVEQVSWQDAMIFCARLSKKTGRLYRLPSEAEWEYACRGITKEQVSAIYPADSTLTTKKLITAWNTHKTLNQPFSFWNTYKTLNQPFSFGPSIITDIANYNGSKSYGNGSTGVDREQTTPVGLFKAPNAFGLHDMHGNVLEWCLDPWHGNYEGMPPSDGSVWDEELKDYSSKDIYDNINIFLASNNDRVLRGGSWNGRPRLCRSAARNHFNPDFRSIYVGLRVVCERPRLS
ncbi:MAG: formylglycine-generating enzyme family protein [Snowella sp.]|nr:formylglycine-generating enzyme family protein [Snowella sp.]